MEESLKPPSEYSFPYMYAALGGKTGYKLTSLLLVIYAIYILHKVVTKKDKKICNSFVVLGFTTILWVIVSLAFSVDIFTFWRYVSVTTEVNSDTLFSAVGLSRSKLWETFSNISWYADLILLGRITLILQNRKLQHPKLYSNILYLIFLISELLGMARLYYQDIKDTSLPEAVLIAHFFTTAVVKITAAMIIFEGRNIYRHDGRLKLAPCFSTPLAAMVVTLVECIFAILSLDLLFIVIFTLPDSILEVLPLRVFFHVQGIAMLCLTIRVVREASLAVLFPYHPPAPAEDNSENDTKPQVIATDSDEKLKEMA